MRKIIDYSIMFQLTLLSSKKFNLILILTMFIGNVISEFDIHLFILYIYFRKKE